MRAPLSANWTYTTGDPVTSCVAIDAEGYVYVGSYDDNLYKLSPATGLPVWNFTTQGEIDASSPLLWNGLVIFGR